MFDSCRSVKLGVPLTAQLAKTLIENGHAIELVKGEFRNFVLIEDDHAIWEIFRTNGTWLTEISPAIGLASLLEMVFAILGPPRLWGVLEEYEVDGAPKY